jgi:hypothetical protein
MENTVDKFVQKEMTLGELEKNLKDVISKCGENSPIFFRFDSNHQFIVRNLKVSECDCCEVKLPMFIGEVM